MEVAMAVRRSTGTLLAALVVGGVTAILDTTIVAIGLRTLTEALHASVATIQWVSTGYLLALAVTIPYVGWAQARFGGKRLWLFALGLFLVGSLLGACAWSAESLIAFRVLQGVGAGIMLPLIQTLAMQHVSPESRTRTMATVSLPAALGPILGPVLGGLVLSWLDWRWLFLINIPIGIVGWILAVVFIDDDRPAPTSPRPGLDVVGAVLLTPALAGLLYALSNTHSEGAFGRADVLLPLAGGAVLLAAFCVRAARLGSTALVDVRLLAVRSVRTSSIALTILGASIYAGTFLLPLYFQTVYGYTALSTAFLLIPQGVGSLVARFVVGALVDRLGPRLVAVLGFLLVAATTAPFAFATTGTDPWLLGAVLLLRGLGLGVVLIPVITVAYLDIRTSDMPQASAITRIVQQLGAAFGTALVAVVLTASAVPTQPRSGFDAAFWLVTGITLVAAAVALLLPGKPRPAGSAATAPEDGDRLPA
jgi:EmrB/QacA subfamily drug resistance transporter